MHPDLDLDFSPEEQRREREFRRRVVPWGLGTVALGVLVPTALVLSGVVDRVAAAFEPWWLAVVATVTLVDASVRLLTLPCAVQVRRESLRVGLAAGPWSRWWRDVALSTAFGWVTGTGVLLGWVFAAQQAPASWPWIVAGAMAALVVVTTFLVPVFFEPIFAEFEPLKDCPLRDRLLALADEAGVRVGDVLVADASRRTTALNAYVSGLGPTRRIVVHDTLVDRGADDEAAAVVAHELGHVAAHDVRTGTLLGAAGAAAGVLVAAALLAWEPARSALQIDGAGDPAAAGALLALGAWAGLLGAPLSNGLSRRIERRADVFCLDLARDPHVVARMHRGLAVANLAPLRPGRILHLWFGTHPTSPERIAAARGWARSHGLPEVPPLVGGRAGSASGDG